MGHFHRYCRSSIRRLASRYPLSIPAAVADALEDVATYEPPSGWEPERLLVLRQGDAFRVVLDLAKEVQWNLPE